MNMPGCRVVVAVGKATEVAQAEATLAQAEGTGTEAEGKATQLLR